VEASVHAHQCMSAAWLTDRCRSAPYAAGWRNRLTV
jgi:hypothetical protein